MDNLLTIPTFGTLSTSPILLVSTAPSSDAPTNRVLYESRGVNTFQILRRNTTNINSNISTKSKDKSTLPVVDPNVTGSACLYISDETIRLTEWLAYHYVVLPLRRVILGISADTRHVQKIAAIAGLWRDRIDITLWNSTQYMTFGNKTGWERELNGWEKDTNSLLYKRLVHKRNQKSFTLHCLNTMKKAGKSWTMVTDVDEFLILNYIGPHENVTEYGGVWKGLTREETNVDRQRKKPLRQALPPMTDQTTILEVLKDYNNSKPCILFPQLKFSSFESNLKPSFLLNHSSFSLTDLIQQLLMTKRFRYHGPKASKFSKTMVDLSAYGSWELDSFAPSAFQSIHNPHKGYCGEIGSIGSGVDYISSILRVNHYGSGTIESLLERGQADYRITDKTNFEDFFQSRNLEPIGTNDDIQPWVDWFIETAGLRESNRLLFEPLQQAYQELETFSFSKLRIELQKVSTQNKGQTTAPLAD